MKILKKYKLLLIHIVLLALLVGLAVEFAEEIQTAKRAVYYMIHPVPVPGATDDQITLYPVENDGDEWFLEYPLIYHAGGEIHGSSYTNSLEAVEKTLAEHPGKCFIEIDLTHTSDGALVCAHNWGDAFLNQTEPPTLEEFVSRKIQGRFTPLTGERLMQMMAENPQMYLVTDVKGETDPVAQVIGELAELCGWEESVLNRLIIQLYTGREKSEIQEIYPFDDDQFVFTTYKWGVWQHEVAQICNEETVSVMAVPYGEMSDEDAALMKELGFTVYEFTVNRADEARHSLERGISGFYTDDLTPEDLIG
ncbi:MAG: hypothetical protein ACI3WQ_02620 [Faecousia sp.]